MTRRTREIRSAENKPAPLMSLDEPHKGRIHPALAAIIGLGSLAILAIKTDLPKDLLNVIEKVHDEVAFEINR